MWEMMANKIADERDALRAQLAALEARYALDMETFATGSRMNAAQLDSTRAGITEIVDAVKAERECEAALDMAKETSNYASWDSAWRTWQDAKALTDMLVRKHEGTGTSEDEAITVEALEREGFTKMEPDDDHTLEYWRNGKVCMMFHVTTTPSVWVENGWYDWSQDGVDVELDVVAVDDCTTIQRINWLVRLFTTEAK